MIDSKKTVSLGEAILSDNVYLKGTYYGQKNTDDLLETFHNP